MSHPTIILANPQMGENIGAAARVMKNFGLTDLRVVAPRDGWPNQAAIDMAAGAADVIHHAKVVDTLEEAIADCQRVLAVTARLRQMVKPVVVLGQDSLIQDDHKTAYLFGAERTGLTNEQVVLADAILAIPTNPDFASLNLAQAVAVVCYELRQVSSLREEGSRRLDQTEHDLKPATKSELIAFLERLEHELEARDAYAFVDEKKGRMIANLRNMFTRSGLTSQEIQSLHGIIKVLTRK